MAQDQLRHPHETARSPRAAIERLERLQQQGLADRALDARCSANALVAMVNGLVHHWLVMGEELDEEQVVHTLTRLWAQSLGLSVGR